MSFIEKISVPASHLSIENKALAFYIVNQWFVFNGFFREPHPKHTLTVTLEHRDKGKLSARAFSLLGNEKCEQGSVAQLGFCSTTEPHSINSTPDP